MDHKTNEEIINELKVNSILVKITSYKKTGYNTKTECQDLDDQIY
jgi:hypothetical protein